MWGEKDVEEGELMKEESSLEGKRAAHLVFDVFECQRSSILQLGLSLWQHGDTVHQPTWKRPICRIPPAAHERCMIVLAEIKRQNCPMAKIPGTDASPESTDQLSPLKVSVELLLKNKQQKITFHR